ncbi:MAG: hypothetical protein AAB784_02035 [Patescibacteria group bacterium]
MSTKKNQIIYLILLLTLLIILIPQHQANAVGLLEFGIKEIAQQIGTFFTELVTTAIGWMAQVIDAFIKYQTEHGVYGITVVDNSWAIIRNFVNMFFILVLIIMAFGTIFSIKNYTWGDMLVPFLIAALLINFSLAIGQYIITVSNGLAGIFLKEIASSGGLTETFATGTGLGQIITSTPSSGVGGMALNAADAVGSVTISLIANLVFLLITLLTFATVAIFSIVRLFALWFLLIISPIAWFGYAMPNLRAKTWTPWWSAFLCWCFFLPYFLFFMMFAVAFIKNKASFPPLGPAQVGSLALTDLLFYGLSIGFMIGGSFQAKKLACTSGSYVSKAFGTIETGVRKYAPGAAYVRGGVAGLKERGAEIAEKGVLGIGGAQKGRLDEAKARGWIAGIPGLGQIPGARETASRAQAAEVEKEMKLLQTLNLTLDQLNEKMQTAKGPEKIAAFKLKSEKGWLGASDLDEINKLLEAAGGGKTAVGASLIQSLVKGKFEEMAEGTEAKERIYAALQDTEVKKAYGRSMAETGELRDTAIARSLLNLYQNESQAEQDKISQLVQKNLENMYLNKSERSAFITALVTDDLDGRLKKMAAQTMIDRGEVDLALRERVIELHGGRDVSGRIKEKQMQELDKKILANIEKGKVSEALLSPADQKAIFDGLTEPEVQKAFGMAMAKNRAVMEEDVATRIIDLYSNDTLEVQEKVHEEIKKNIENMAGTKDVKLRTSYLSNTGNDVTMRKLVGQIMADKKEVRDWQTRRTVLELNGDIDPVSGNPITAAGRDIAKSIQDGNVVIKEEATYRKTNTIPHGTDLNTSQRADLQQQILTNIENRYITSFSTEELETPEVFNALCQGVQSGSIPVDKFNNLIGLGTGKGAGKSDRKKREAGAKILAAAFP